MEKLTVTEYKNIRVLTTQQIAEAYGTSTDTITKNFNRNKERYTEDKHYIALEGAGKSAFVDQGQFDRGLKNAKTLYLWTKKGAFLHAKSLNTDTAWEVYDRLVDSYFDKQEMIPKDYPTALRALADECEKRMQVEQENKLLISENETMKPKAEFFDELVDRNLLVNFRDAAKTLEIKQKDFIQFLCDSKYIYYDAHNHIRPYADKNNGLFKLKPYTSRYSEHAGEQTMITPRGLETFRLLMKNV